MAYVRTTLKKKRPACKGKVLFEQPEYLVFWKFTTAKPPAPKRWANLVVFLKDPIANHKRSYHVAWNGQQMARSACALDLGFRRPDILSDVIARLPAHNERLVKPTKGEDQ